MCEDTALPLSVAGCLSKACRSIDDGAVFNDKLLKLIADLLACRLTDRSVWSGDMPLQPQWSVVRALA